ncbi:hypothetical protein [Nocardiopsis sp. SBT366]|uniref:hypothetical protein n=1 Tax=Nocardiopsis sp. SBT366 TaxID=1580529 RepID=UPI000AD1E1AE|nr:hypothetical protein [Nocardiopsis sp. SBT366]
MSTSMPSTEQELEEVPGQPNWLLSLLVAVASLAVVASGWSVARLTLDGESAVPPLADPVGVESPLVRAVDADPSDPEVFLESAVQKVRDAPAFHVSYTRTVEGEEPAQGWARHEPGSDTAFEHYFESSEGVRVHRYDLPGTGFMMTAEKGLPGMTVLTQPTEADRRLCSEEFVLGVLEDLVETATDLELVGSEKIDLPESTRGVGASTHTAYRYSGTFATEAGDYLLEPGRNSLVQVPEARFDLWVDEGGHPRRLSYTAPNGFGETYEYHPVET